ncbi:MAG TPA: DoxX family membrane protein [Bacteroidales bacterium]|nr:DoxX family membrane protein [Bacteroidales bacterium]
MKSLTTTVARIIFAIPFLIFGIFHFMNMTQMAGYLSEWPLAKFFVIFSGVGFILASIAMIINRFARLAALLLALELLIIILAIHVPGLSNPDMMQMNITAILKNTGLIGGALMVAGFSKN